MDEGKDDGEQKLLKSHHGALVWKSYTGYTFIPLSCSTTVLGENYKKKLVLPSVSSSISQHFELSPNFDQA